MQVLKECDDTCLGGSVQLDDAYWGGERHGGKRGRGSAGQDAVHRRDRHQPRGPAGDNAPEPCRRVSQRGDRRLGEVATSRLARSWGPTPWATFAVRHAGCFHQPIVTGNGPASRQHPAFTWVDTILGNIKRSLHGTYYHVNSKHLPRYMAEFSYRFNLRFSLREMLPQLAYVAVRTPPMHCRVLELG